MMSDPQNRLAGVDQPRTRVMVAGARDDALSPPRLIFCRRGAVEGYHRVGLTSGYGANNLIYIPAGTMCMDLRLARPCWRDVTIPL
jgi:hypothetical protein